MVKTKVGLTDNGNPTLSVVCSFTHTLCRAVLLHTVWVSGIFTGSSVWLHTARLQQLSQIFVRYLCVLLFLYEFQELIRKAMHRNKCVCLVSFIHQRIYAFDGLRYVVRAFVHNTQSSDRLISRTFSKVFSPTLRYLFSSSSGMVRNKLTSIT